MAISVRVSGTWAVSTTQSPAVTIPAGYQIGDLGILVSAWRSFGVTATVNQSWQEIIDLAAGSTANGNGVGSSQLYVAYKVFTSASDTNPTLTRSGAINPGGQVIIVLQKGANDGDWKVEALSAAVEQAMATTAMSHAATTTARIFVNELVFALTGVADDTATFTRASTAISGGPTWADVVVEYPATHASSTSGNDMAADLIYRVASSEVASAQSLTITATLSAAERVGSVLFGVRVGPSGSFTADAVIKKLDQSGSATANAVTKKTVTPTGFTADALKSMVPVTFTANAVIKQGKSGSFTANAVVRKTDIAGTPFTANAIILRAAGTVPFAANAVIKKTQSGAAQQFTVNAVIKKPGIVPGTQPTADAVARKTVSGAPQSFTGDAWFVATRTFTDKKADAAIRATISGSKTADAIRLRTMVFGYSFQGGAFQEDAFQRGPTLNAVVLRTVSHTFDSGIFDPNLFDCGINLNAIISATVAGGKTADAAIFAAIETGFSADAVVGLGMVTQTGSFAANAIVKKSSASDYSANAVVLRSASSSLLADAIKALTTSSSWLSNAVISSSVTSSFSSAAVFRKEATSSFSSAAVVFRPTADSFSANAVVARTIPGNYAARAVVNRAAQFAFTANGVVKASATTSLLADASIQRPTETTLTTNAIVRVPRETGTTVDAFVQPWFRADAYITAKLTADAVLLRTIEQAFTAKAWVQGFGVSGFSSDAVIWRSQSGYFIALSLTRATASGLAFSGNAIVLVGTASSFSTNAIKRSIAASSFTCAAAIRASASSSFTLAALTLAPVTSFFSSDSVVLKPTGSSFTANGVARLESGSAFTVDAVVLRVASTNLATDAIVLVPGTAGTGSYAPTVLADSPVAYWRLGEKPVTPLLACGFEEASPFSAHWYRNDSGVQRTVAVSRSGAASLQIDCVSSRTTFAQYTPVASSYYWTVRYAVMFTTLPTADACIAELYAVGAAPNIVMGYDAAANRLALFRVNGWAQRKSSSMTIQAGVWYVVDWRHNSSGSTGLCDWAVDGVSQDQLAVAQTPSVFDWLYLGQRPQLTLQNFTVYYDDVVVTHTLSDYPIGDGAVGWTGSAEVFPVANDEVGTADGTYVNTPTLGVTGAISDGNTAVTFDRTIPENVTLGSAINFASAGWSVEFWHKRNAATTNQQLVYIAGTADTGVQINGPAVGRFRVIGYGGVFACTSAAAGDITDDNWHHIVATKDASNAYSIYIDGVDRTVFVASPAWTTGSYSFEFPRTNAGYEIGGGSLDEVAVYSAALTSTQVAAHYAIGAAVSLRAVLRRGSTASLTTNAIVLRTQPGSLTGDAVVKRTNGGEPFVDAVVRRVTTTSLTTNAIVQRAVTAGPIADAVIHSAFAYTFTAGACIAGTFTADGITRKTNTGTATADSVVMPVFVGNAILRRSQGDSFTAGAWIPAVGVNGFSIDSVLRAVIGREFTENAVARVQTSGTIISDAVISAAQSGAFIADAVTRKSEAGYLTADAVLVAGRTVGFSANSVLLSPSSRSANANAVLRASRSGSALADSTLRSGRTGQLVAHATVGVPRGGGLTADAYILAAEAAVFSANAVIFREQLAQFPGNALVNQIVQSGLNADAAIQAAHVGSFRAEAAVQATLERAFQSYAVTLISVNGSVNSFGLISLSNSGSFSATAWIVERKEFASDAIIKGQRADSFSTNSLVILPTAPFDAILDLEFIEASLNLSFIEATLQLDIVEATLQLDAYEATVGVGYIEATIATSLWTWPTGHFTADAVLEA